MSGTLCTGRRQSLAIGGLETIICHVVDSHDVFAMAYDIAHVCVADLDYVMIPCVCTHVNGEKAIRTRKVYITTKGAIAE